VGLIIPLVLFGLGALPARWLGRRAAAGGAFVMFAAFAISLAAVLGPNSDTSRDESNWESHDAHAFIVGVLALEAACAAALAALAVRGAAVSTVRIALLGSGVASIVLLLALAQALSN
jgi:hypothetical protein